MYYTERKVRGQKKIARYAIFGELARASTQGGGAPLFYSKKTSPLPQEEIFLNNSTCSKRFLLVGRGFLSAAKRFVFFELLAASGPFVLHQEENPVAARG